MLEAGRPDDAVSHVAHVIPGAHILLEGEGTKTCQLLKAWIEELVAQGRDVVVLHRAHSADRLALAGEFPETPSLHYLPVAGRRRELGHDPLAPAALARLVPDVRSRDVFVCGPPAMVDTVRASARALGVPRAAIHTEELSLA